MTVARCAVWAACFGTLVACRNGGTEPPATPTDSGVVADGSAPSATLVLLSTTDLHARILPFDYYSAADEPTIGLAKVAAVVRRLRAENPCTLLIDSGDTIQGTPLGTLYARADGPPHPMAAAMAAIGYDAMALGNHEFNYGLPVLRKFIRDAPFAVLAANVRNAADGTEAFGSYVIKDVCGVKVGVLGVVATVPRLVEPAAHVANLRFDPILATVKTYAPKMRAAGATVVVVAMHGGPDRGPADGNWDSFSLPPSTAPKETDAAMLLVAEEVPEVDVILGGHAHREVPKVVINNTIALEAGQFGRKLGRVTLNVEAGAIVAKDAALIDPLESAPDPAVVEAAKTAHDATVAWVDEKVGAASGEFFGGAEGAYYVDSPLADLINAMQIEVAAGAGYAVDVSASAVLSAKGLPTGDIKRRDVFTIYPFDNTLAVVEMSGDVLQEALAINGNVWETLDAAPPPETPAGVMWRTPRYNFDFFTHIAYAYDFTLPLGFRLLSATLDGKPIQSTKSYLVAVNSFRANGNGNAAFAKGVVKWESPKSAREYLLDYVAARSPLAPDAINTCNVAFTPDLFARFFKPARTAKCSP